jgi:hypothetical protein
VTAAGWQGKTELQRLIPGASHVCIVTCGIGEASTGVGGGRQMEAVACRMAGQGDWQG